MGLELYSEIEPFLNKIANPTKLHKFYIEILKKFNPETILDLGCGSGDFMVMAKKEGFNIKGIDLSENMINSAKNKNLDVKVANICKIKEPVDMVVAIFDVLNYIPKKDLKEFLNGISKNLKKGGYFIADINTLFGFEEIAQGTASIDKNDKFIVLDSIYENNSLITNITLFKKEKDSKNFKKSSDKIIQYFHKKESIKSKNLKLIDVIEYSLYEFENDKNILIFQKV